MKLTELERKVEATAAPCPYDGELMHCHCPAHEAVDYLEARAPALAGMVVQLVKALERVRDAGTDGPDPMPEVLTALAALDMLEVRDG